MARKRVRNPFNLKKVLIWVGAVVGTLCLLILAFLYLNPAYSVPADIVSFVHAAVVKQQKIEADLLAAYRAGKFTFNAPLVVQDPYQSAPLTALVIFDTPENSQISIHVPGKTPQAAVDFTFPGYQQHHEIPVYGLYADTLNHVVMSMKTQDGVNKQTVIDLQTEPLPTDMQKFQVDKVDRAKYSPGFNFTTLDQKPVFDIDGNVRWYSTQDSFYVFTPLKDGRFLFTYTTGKVVGNLVMEQDLLGKIYAIYNIADGISHDIYELPNGNLLITTSGLDDNIAEVDRSSGHIVRQFDLKSILDPNRPPLPGAEPKDWLHLNSIVYDPTDKSIILSGREQSAVVKMTYPGMQIQWILGPHDNWSPKYQPYLLTPVGTNFEWPWSQHHATLYGQDPPGDQSIDILLFDNGMYRSFQPSKAVSPSQSYSRVVHYRINEAAMTVEQVWEYGKENGSDTFSAIRGSAFLLPNGDVLGTWANIFKDAKGNPAIDLYTNGSVEAKIIEVVPSNPQGTGTGGEVVFECTLPNMWNYRTLRAGFYDGYSVENPLLSTALNDTSGNDLVDRSGMAWRDLIQWKNDVAAGRVKPWKPIWKWTYTNPVMVSIRRWGRQILRSVK
ncbi:MAG: aryl-sulfate sulfotransferase [Anaerolineales bacterium]